jgi:sulfatase maturation enzyme AslB (radical SAM superfamily)
MNQFRLRIITNLHCNCHCQFCYQKRKAEIVLPFIKLRDAIGGRHFERASVMGGETLLLQNAEEYIRIAADAATTVGLTTNGVFLTPVRAKGLAKAGVQELAVSVPSFLHYQEITGADLHRTLANIEAAKRYVPNVRLNITQNRFNMNNENGTPEIYLMIRETLRTGVGVVICEDITAEFKMDFKKYLGDEVTMKSCEYGFETWELNGIPFGFFHGATNYDDTDLIVTPVGNFNNWKDYCDEVGCEIR